MKMMTALNDMMALQDEYLHEIWQKLFTKVFLKRKSDVAEAMREACAAECGLWLKMFPQCYISRTSMLHLFEALEDRSPKVWAASLYSIVGLEKKPKLRTDFLQLGFKFRMTLLSLSLNDDTNLAYMAISLIVSIQRSMPEVVDENMVELIEQLVFSANRKVGQAAAELLHVRFKEEPTAKDRVLALARFFVKFFGHERTPYLIDAFYGVSDSLLDWATMVDILKSTENLTYQEVTVIIEILARSVRQAVTGDLPAGRATEALVSLPLHGADEQVTTIILPAMNTLLNQYWPDPLRMEFLFDLSLHINCSDAQAEELISEMKSLLFKLTDLKLLRVCATTLHRLIHKHEQVAVNLRKELMERSAHGFLKAASAWQLSVKKMQKSRLKACAKQLLITLRVATSVNEHFDLSGFQVMKSVMGCLKQVINEPMVKLCDESMTLCLEMSFVSICWDLKRAEEAASTGNQMDEDYLMLAERLDDYFLCAFHILKKCGDVSLRCDVSTHFPCAAQPTYSCCSSSSTSCTPGFQLHV